MHQSYMDQLDFPSFQVVLAFLLFIFMVLRIRKNSKTKNLNPPPGPWRFPLIGNIDKVVGSLTHQRFRDLAKIYGPVMQLKLGEVPFVVISSPEAAKEVMKTQEVYFVDRPVGTIPNIVFYGSKDIAFAPYGDYWRQLRKFCTSNLLSPHCVRSFAASRGDELSNFIRFISTEEGSPINLSKLIFKSTFTVIARIIIGKKCKNHEVLFSTIEEWKKVGAGFDIADIFPSFKLLHKLNWTGSKFLTQHRQVDRILETIIHERRASRVGTEPGETEAEDFLDVLLNIQDGGNFEFPFTDENIKALILEIFLAGSDTSSTVIEWAMSEMLKNTKVMRDAQKEVRGVFTKTGDVHETELHELKFLKLVIKETIRLHPPGALILRSCIEGCKINGHDILAKSYVMINAWAIGRDPDYWNEADKFYPERFLDSSLDYMGNNFEFIPFGAGKRKCPGMSFGLAIAELTLANFLYHFDWELCDGLKNEDLDMTEDIALGSNVKRKQDLNLIPIPYRPSPLG